MFLSTVLGFVAVEAGWIVTELGRQPWIIQGVMRTSEAVSPMPGLLVPFVLFTIVYIGLGAVVIALIRRTVLETIPERGVRDRWKRTTSSSCADRRSCVLRSTARTVLGPDICLARVAAASQVGLILWGWALAQYPYAIRPHLTFAAAAALPGVQVLLLQVLGIGAVILLPCLLYLFGIFGPRGHESATR